MESFIKMEYTKDTIIGYDSSGFSISVVQLYPGVQRDLLSQPKLYEACKLARHYLESRPGKVTPAIREILNNLIHALAEALAKTDGREE